MAKRPSLSAIQPAPGMLAQIQPQPAQAKRVATRPLVGPAPSALGPWPQRGRGTERTPTHA